MTSTKPPTMPPVLVFSRLKYLMRLCGIFIKDSRKKVLLVLNIFVPNVYFLLCSVWLYFELNFDITLVAQSFAVVVSDTQGMLVYSYFLMNECSILEAFESLQGLVDKRIVSAVIFHINYGISQFRNILCRTQVAWNRWKLGTFIANAMLLMANYCGKYSFWLSS